MRPFQRQETPQVLQAHAERWNRQWAARKQQNPGATFQWYQDQGRPVNQHIIGQLMHQTDEHCSYCDNYPSGVSDKTIDHFFPKSHPDYYLLAYEWSNLYAACADCQDIKMESVPTNVLRPDAPDYRFERYFLYNYTSHLIEVNPLSTEAEQAQAAATISIFNFNHEARVISRRHQWERWSNAENPVLEDYAFRFILT